MIDMLTEGCSMCCDYLGEFLLSRTVLSLSSVYTTTLEGA